MPPRTDVVSITGSSARIRSRAQQPRATGPEPADRPVGRGAERGEPRRVGRRLVERGEERQLGDVVGVGLHQPVPGLAQLAHEQELVVLEVLEAAPHEVRRLLAGERGEVAAVDERHRRAPAGQRRRRHGTVDAAADDEHVERAVPHPVDAGVPKRHGRTVPTGPAAVAGRRRPRCRILAETKDAPCDTSDSPPSPSSWPSRRPSWSRRPTPAPPGNARTAASPGGAAQGRRKRPGRPAEPDRRRPHRPPQLL